MPRTVGNSLRAASCFLTGCAFALVPFRFAGAPEGTSRWLLFTGDFHPLLLHLPIGIVCAIAGFEVWGLVRGKSEPALRHFLWLLAAISASLSFATGYVAGAGGGHDPELLKPHLWLAGGFTALCWFSLGVLLFKDIAVTRFAAWAGVALAMSAAGHFGGLMVHGSPLANAPWRPDPTAIEILPPLGEKIGVYPDLVRPILTAKCQACHGPGKQNGRLRIDSLERALAGGAHGPALVPGRAKESRLLQTILLPLENEKHMPPKNRPQLNQAEIDLLHWWIETGAPGGTILTAAEAPEVIKPFLVLSYRLLPNPELIARRQREEKKQREEQAKRRATLETALAKLPPQQRAWFSFSSEASADLEFAVTTSPESFGDEQLAPLGALLRDCSRITLASTKVTDDGLAGLRLSSTVRQLNLNRTSISNRGLQSLTEATQLELLNIYGTTVDDGLATQLPPLRALRRLFVGSTRLSAETLEQLRRSHPQAEIIGSLSVALDTVRNIPLAPPAAPEISDP